MPEVVAEVGPQDLPFKQGPIVIPGDNLLSIKGAEVTVTTGQSSKRSTISRTELISVRAASDMTLAVLLKAFNIKCATNCDGRSPRSPERCRTCRLPPDAQSAGPELRAIQTGSGHRDLASDLTRLAALYE
ncbi:MAG: hypothetical protein P8X85_01780 [Desulfobacterales bacterium]